jgi:hypothetical protein
MDVNITYVVYYAVRLVRLIKSSVIGPSTQIQPGPYENTQVKKSKMNLDERSN